MVIDVRCFVKRIFVFPSHRQLLKYTCNHSVPLWFHAAKKECRLFTCLSSVFAASGLAKLFKIGYFNNAISQI